jgi:hypothetical protein
VSKWYRLSNGCGEPQSRFGLRKQRRFRALKARARVMGPSYEVSD